MAFSPQRQEQLGKLGLLEDPFTTSADPRFMYLSEQHAQVMHEARGVVEAFRGLAVVEGSLGVGKSTIARSLDNIYRDQPDSYRVVYVHSAGWESEYAGLLEITSALKLRRRKGGTAQWNELDGFLVEEHRRGRNVVLILDDGQLMAPRSMRLIHRLYNFDLQRKLAQIVVFGQPEIRYLFDAHPEVRSRVDSWREGKSEVDFVVRTGRSLTAIAVKSTPRSTPTRGLDAFAATFGPARRILVSGDGIPVAHFLSRDGESWAVSG